MPGPSQEFKNKYPHLFSGSANLLDKRDIPFIKNNPDFFAGQSLTDKPVDNKRNVDIDAELNSAVAQKDITPDIARQLKKEYGHDPNALKQKLDTYKGERSKCLRSLSWDELDKKGLLNELKESDFATYRKKFFVKFGKHPKEHEEKLKQQVVSPQEIKNKEKLLVDDGSYDAGNLKWRRTFFDSDEKWNNWLDGQIALMETDFSDWDWDELDKNGKLEELKESNLGLFKQKFKDKFGVEFKDKAATKKTSSLSDTSAPALDKSYYTDSWQVLDRQGKLENLKAQNVDLFKQKFKEKFGVDYKGL